MLLVTQDKMSNVVFKFILADIHQVQFQVQWCFCTENGPAYIQDFKEVINSVRLASTDTAQLTAVIKLY